MRTSVKAGISLAAIALVATLCLAVIQTFEAPRTESVSARDSMPRASDPRARIEIDNLRPTYNIDRPIEFSVSGHNLSGCVGIDLTISDFLNPYPPVYKTRFVTECNDHTWLHPANYTYPVRISSLNATEAGTYSVLAEYWQHRASYGEDRKIFQITVFPDIDERMYGVRTMLSTFSNTIDAGPKGLFTVSGMIQGAKISDMFYDEYGNQIQISLAESRGGNLRITIPYSLFDSASLRFAGFVVLVDLEEVSYGEEADGSRHVLNITIPENAEEILIIGTHYLN